MTISVATFEVDLAKAQSYAAAFSAIASTAPSIVRSVSSAGPANVQAGGQHIADVLQGMLSFLGHELTIIEAIWPQIKPLLVIALDLAGNPALAALVNAIPVVMPGASSPA